MVAQAQKEEKLEVKMFFASKDSAVNNFWSGNFRYYLSDPKNVKSQYPINAKGLPYPYVVKEEVRENPLGPIAWVILPEGRPAVFGSNGQPVKDGVCWNKIFEGYPLIDTTKYVPLSMVGSLYGPPGIQGPPGKQGPQGYRGYKGDDASFGIWQALETAGFVAGAYLLYRLIKSLLQKNQGPEVVTVNAGPGVQTLKTKTGINFNFGFAFH